MAIRTKRRTTKEHVELVWPADPAIDQEASDFGEYVSSGYDLRHIKEVDGEVATVFRVRGISEEEHTECLVVSARYGTGAAAALWREVALMCLVQVDNWMHDDGEIGPLTEWSAIPADCLLWLGRQILKLSEEDIDGKKLQPPCS